MERQSCGRGLMVESKVHRKVGEGVGAMKCSGSELGFEISNFFLFLSLFLVKILNESTQEKCKAFGRFPITGVWWRVKVQAKPVGSANYRVQGLPSYFLQTDMSPPNQKEICSLFLTECQVTSDKIGRFLKWVEEDSSYEDLNFENLTEKLRTFERKVERKEDNPPVQSEEGEPASDHELCLPVEGTG